MFVISRNEFIFLLQNAPYGFDGNDGPRATRSLQLVTASAHLRLDESVALGKKGKEVRKGWRDDRTEKKDGGLRTRDVSNTSFRWEEL